MVMSKTQVNENINIMGTDKSFHCTPTIINKEDEQLTIWRKSQISLNFIDMGASVLPLTGSEV